MWQIIHLHASLLDRLCNGMHAYVAHNATVCMLVWQTKHCMHAGVGHTACSRIYDCVRTCVTDYANVFTLVWQIQPV